MMMVNFVMVVMGGGGGQDVLVIMVVVEDRILRQIIVGYSGMIIKREMFEMNFFFGGNFIVFFYF